MTCKKKDRTNLIFCRTFVYILGVEDKVSKLTVQQELFCAEYINDFNGTKAAIRAGYSKNGAHVTASKLLKQAKVQARCAELIRERQKRKGHEATVDRWLEEVMILAFQDMKDHAEIDESGLIKLLPFDKMPEGASRAIAKLKERRSIRQSQDDSGDMILDSQLEYGHHSKEKALEMLGRYLGIFKDKMEHSGKVEGPAPVTIINYSAAIPPKS